MQPHHRHPTVRALCGHVRHFLQALVEGSKDREAKVAPVSLHSQHVWWTVTQCHTHVSPLCKRVWHSSHEQACHVTHCHTHVAPATHTSQDSMYNLPSPTTHEEGGVVAPPTLLAHTCGGPQCLLIPLCCLRFCPSPILLRPCPCSCLRPSTLARCVDTSRRQDRGLCACGRGVGGGSPCSALPPCPVFVAVRASVAPLPLVLPLLLFSLGPPAFWLVLVQRCSLPCHSLCAPLVLV